MTNQHLDVQQAAAQLTRSGAHWDPMGGKTLALTYGMRSGLPPIDPYELTFLNGTFSQITNASEIIAIENSLKAWSDVANIRFFRFDSIPDRPVDGDLSTILFGNYAMAGPDAAFAYMPGSAASPEFSAPGDRTASSRDGNVWFNTAHPFNVATNFLPGTYSLLALMHEIGHALGLDHPSDYPRDRLANYFRDAAYIEDTLQYSIMSYFGPREFASIGSEANWMSQGLNGPIFWFPSTPMVHDIAAIQQLYGSAPNTRAGNTRYGFNGNAGAPYDLQSFADERVYTIYDTRGFDTIDMSGYSTTQVINLTPGSYSSTGTLTLNLAIATNTWIESAEGESAADWLLGNERGNVLSGNGGDDWIWGFGGVNTLYGGFDVDHLFAGNDGDFLYGETGDDILAGGLGKDTLDGGPGTDTVNYALAQSAVTVHLDYYRLAKRNIAPNAFGDGIGTDKLVSIENIIGSDQRDFLYGSGIGNTIEGGLGGDELYGLGGADLLKPGVQGKDLLDGGDGDDIVDYSFATSSLVASLETHIMGTFIRKGAFGADVGPEGDSFVSIEGIIGGSAGDRLYGDDKINMLDGRLGSDFLYGFAGDDTLIGGLGDDLLDGGDQRDTADYSTARAQVIATLDDRAFGEDIGTDTLVSIENLIGGKSRDELTGNDDDNVIDGGPGADVMSGLGGNDTYIVDDANDEIYELALSGVDKVTLLMTLIFNSYTVPDYVEEVNVVPGLGMTALTVTGSDFSDHIIGASTDDTFIGGGGNDDLFGHGGRDRLEGGSGNDYLSGGTEDDIMAGGMGGDQFIGGPGKDKMYAVDETLLTSRDDGGADVFIFESASDSRPNDPDQIFNFSFADGDRIDLSRIDSNGVKQGDPQFRFSVTPTDLPSAIYLTAGTGANAGDTLINVNILKDKKHKPLPEMIIILEGIDFDLAQSHGSSLFYL